MVLSWDSHDLPDQERGAIPQNPKAMAPTPDSERHRGLRVFLVGVRLMGLMSALLVSRFHKSPLALADTLADYSMAVTAVVIFYHLVAGALVAATESRGITGVLVLGDICFGTLMTYAYGEAYFLLALALPVLEICASFGLAAGLVGAVLGMMFYGVVYARPLLVGYQNQAITLDTLSLRLSLSGVQAAVSVLLAWLYSLAVMEGNRARSVSAEAARTTQDLYAQLAERTEEAELIFAEMSDTEAKLAKVVKETAHLEHELEEAYKDLAKSRLTASSKESKAEEKVSKMSDEMWRERQMLEDQAIKLEQELADKKKTMDGFRQILGSLSLEDTLLSLVYHLQARMKSAMCVVFMTEDVQGVEYLYPEVADAPDTDFFRELAVPVGEQAVGWVAATGRPLRINDSKVQTKDGTFEVLENQGRSALIMPLRDAEQDKTIGVLYMGREEVNGFNQELQNNLEEFLSLASVAVARCLEFRYRVGGGLHDPVTGLHNGMYLAERMEEEVRRGRRYTYPVSLLMVDIDRFTPMQEKLGTDVIDNILRQISGLIIEAIRDTDVAARIDGDDFGVLLVHSDRDSAVPIGERIRQEVSQTTFGTPGQPLRLTVSVGVAGVPHDASDGDRLKEAAFGAIAQARARGGNCVSIFAR